MVGFEPTSDTDGKENLRFGWISCNQPVDGRRAWEGPMRGGGGTCSSSLEATASLSGVGRRSVALALSAKEAVKPPL